MIEGVGELGASGLRGPIVKGLRRLAETQDHLTLANARSEPLDVIRYRAGVADGIRIAADALQPKDSDG